MRNILVVYWYLGEYPPRKTIADHLYCFGKDPRARVFYLNLGVSQVPGYLREVPFDLVVFHTTFGAARWNPAEFRALMRKAAPLIRPGTTMAVLPQDEFIHTDALGEFIRTFGIGHVFSVAPESEWPRIYPGLAEAGVQFHMILTGYLDPETLAEIDMLARQVTRRELDVGYRAWRAEAWLGRHGLLKVKLSDVFQEEVTGRGLRADCSTREADTLLGASWYEFLLRCRYTIGVEGGASILDRDGAIREATRRYVEAHPTATFDEIEAACFPGLDGTLHLFAISPRHLEACATRTGQVLVEGHYNGVLEAGRHYLPLKADLSNLPEVLDQLQDEDLRRRMVEDAYQDIIASGKYTYQHLVDTVYAAALKGGSAQPVVPGLGLRHAVARLADRGAWGLVVLRALVRKHLPGLRPLVQRLRARRVLATGS